MAVVLLVALPAVVFGVPALLGHPVLPGDDLTQNFPLRVLVGQQLRNGQLPLYNPYIWSGAPLLAGWNAGAAYPLTFLFAIFPATAAWSLNLIVTWAVAGTGMFFFLRALRLASLPGVLGALSFAFAGAMSAQVAHLGLVAGMSWVPVQLLCVLRLSETRGSASRLRWIAALAAAFGGTMLAGEPRAVDDACVVVGVFAVWRLARLGRGCAPAVVSIAASTALGLCLGAVQWLPGLAAISTSQRAATSAALFNSGSLPARWLLLILVPDLLGGSGSFGQPTFFTHYNLAEVTSYVGILPLVAAAALLGRLRLRPRPPEWIIWHVVALVGVVLALGGNTPAGHVLAHVPFFGSQRLQSRNILVTDLALAVLLAYWTEGLLSDQSQPAGLARDGRRMGRLDLDRILGVLPALAMIAVAVLGLCWGAGFLHWLGVNGSAAHASGRLKPWLVPYALMGAGAAALVIFACHLPPRRRSRLTGGFIALDLVVFTLLGVVAVLPGAGSSAPAASRGYRADRVILPGRARASPAARTPAARPIAALGYPGRFAIYDPGELDAGQLPFLGSPDLNATTATWSVQGYSSIVAGFYASATGAHRVTGEGQDVLSPLAIGDGTLDQLDTSVLLTLPAYLMTAAGGSGPSAAPPDAGQRDIAAGHTATWYLGRPLEVSRLEVPDSAAARDAAAGTRVGLLTPGGSVRWLAARAAGPAQLAVRLPHPMTGIAVVGRAGRDGSHLGRPLVVDSGGRAYLADGPLQNALVPPRWGFAGMDGSFAVFVDHFARGPLTVAPLPGRSASGASVRRVAGPPAAPLAAAVSSARGIRVVRSVAAIAGWSASWHPRSGRTVALAVHRLGLVQAVDVPPGSGILDWSYTAPRFTAGLGLSLGATAIILLLGAGGWLLGAGGGLVGAGGGPARRRARRSRSAP